MAAGRLPARASAASVTGAAAAIGVLAVAALSWLTLAGFAWNDYDTEASRSYAALAAGDLGGFLGLAPPYGGSLILRAPFAGAAAALGGGELAVYRAVSVPCIVVLVAVATWLAARMAAAGRPRRTCLLVAALFAANPISLTALELGHPEELLGVALCVAAVLAGASGRATAAGVLLGLALANKAWAVLAVGPVLLALHRGHARALVAAALVAGAVLAPLALAGDARTLAAATATTGTIFKPWHVWWFFGEPGAVIAEIGATLTGYRTAPEWLMGLTRPLTVGAGALLALGAWLRRGRRGAGEDALLVLALVLLVRCLLDPWNNGYYGLGAVLALLAWEGLRTDEPPVRALLATVLSWLTFSWLNGPLSADASAVSYLVWAVPLAGWMAGRVLLRPAATGSRALAGAARARPAAARAAAAA